MAKQHLLMLGLFLAGAGALASGCSDTKAVGIEDEQAGATGDAGAKGEAGAGNAGSGDAGSGNSGSSDAGSGNEAGATGEDGMGGEGGEGGEPAFVFPPTLNPQAVVVVGPPPSTASTLLVGGTNYSTKTEIVSVTIGSGALGDSTTYDDGDTLATSSAGVGFAIERRNDKVHLLDAGKIAKTFDLKEAGSNSGTVDQKAYVPFLHQSLIAVLDLAEGKVSHRIDLNEYNALGDSDHSADISAGVYDPNKKIAYFLLQRIDIPSINSDPKFQLHCAPYRGLIVGIDPKTDEVVDLNGSAAGKAIELELVNPNSLSINADGTALYLLASGCYDGDNRAHHGVEVVDLEDGTTTVAYTATGNDFLARMIKTVGADALIQSYDDVFASHWHKIDLAAGTLGAEVANVPQAPSFDGTDLLGVEVANKVGKVVRYKLATETSTVISPTSWGGEYSSAAATALVQ